MNTLLRLKLLFWLLSLIVKQIDDCIAVKKVGQCHHRPQSDPIQYHYEVSAEFLAHWQLGILEKGQHGQHKETVKEFQNHIEEGPIDHKKVKPGRGLLVWFQKR